MARAKKISTEDRVIAFTKKAIQEADTFRDEVLFPAILKANAQYRGDLPKRLTPKKRRRIFYQKTRQRVQALQGEIVNAAFSAGRNVINLMRQGVEDNQTIKVLHEVANWHLRNTVDTFGLFINTGEDAQLRQVAAIKCSWRYVQLRTTEEIALPDGSTQEVEVIDVVEDRPICMAVPIERLRWDPKATSCGVPWEDARYVTHSEFYQPDDLLAKATIGEFDPAAVKKIIGRFSELKKTGAEVSRAGIHPMRFPEQQVKDSTRGYTYGLSQDEDGIEIAEVQARLDINNDGYPEKVWYFYAPQFDILVTQPIPLPWPDRTFNIVLGTAIPRAYRIQGESVPEQIADLQAAINSQSNRLDDALAMIVEQGWIVENGANVDLNALAAARYITTTDDINAVKAREHQEVPATYFTSLKDKEQEIDERLGITGTFLGSSQVPASAPATTSVQNVQQSGKRIAYTMNSLVHTLYLPAFKKFAMYVAKFETDENIFRIANEIAAGGQIVNYFPAPEELAYDLRTSMSFGPSDRTIRVAELNQTLALMLQLVNIPLQGPEGPVTPNIKQLVDDIMRYQNVPDADAYWLPAAPPALPPSPAGGTPPGGQAGPAAGGGRAPTVSNVRGPELPLDALLGGLSPSPAGPGGNV